MTLTGVAFVETHWEKPNWNWLQDRIERIGDRIAKEQWSYMLPLFE